jgi:hypothetical protein
MIAAFQPGKMQGLAVHRAFAGTLPSQRQSTTKSILEFWEFDCWKDFLNIP